MINRIIDLSAKHRLAVVLVTFTGALAGWWSMTRLPLDALPDLGDTQVIVYSQWDRSPDLIEDHVTYPIVSALVGAPHVKAVRGLSDFGASFVYVIFDESNMNWKNEYKIFLWLLGFFLFAYFMPIQNETFSAAVIAAFDLAKWYAQEHVLLCLIPAFFIAGVIAVFISQAAVIKYFGAKAKKWVAYLVAAGSGTILAVCSCTVLPLFSRIHKRGAGLGPAMAFLYSGPAINILAIILTARILGIELGIARVIGAVSFSVIIGLIMAFIYRKEEKEKSDAQMNMPDIPEVRPMWQTSLHFFILVAILVFVNLGKPDSLEGFWYFMFATKWFITSIFGIGFALSMIYIIKVKKLFVILGTIAVILAAIFYCPLEVDALARAEPAQRGARERFRRQIGDEPSRRGPRDGQARAVDRDALARLQRLTNELARQLEAGAAAPSRQRPGRRDRRDQAAKHRSPPRRRQGRRRRGGPR